jgi:DivIVA domain-containing protein
MAALDVLRTVEFKLGLKGYNVDEVDEFLERAAVEAEHLKDQLRQQQQQLRQAAERISQLEADRRGAATPAPAPAPAGAEAAPAPAATATAGAEQVAQMIAMAQQFVSQTQREAETRAREMTAAAQDRAKEIVSEAQNRAQDEVTRLNGLKQRLSEDVDKLARQVDAERSRLRVQLREFLRWVEESLQSSSADGSSPPPATSPSAAPIAASPPAPSALAEPSGPSDDAPPPAPPREPAPTIGQVLRFEDDERS